MHNLLPVGNALLAVRTAARARLRRSLRVRGDSGETLVEVLVSVVIMATVFVVLLTGLETGVSGSTLHRDQANVGVVLLSSLDAIKAKAPPSGTTSYSPCPVGTYTLAAGDVTFPAGTSWSLSNVQIAVQGWNGSAFTSCSGLLVDGKLQKVTVTVTSPDGKYVLSSDVVLRNRS